MHLRELDLVNDVLVCVPLLLAGSVLGHLFNLNLTVLSDDFLNVELQESVKAANLLRY